MHRFIFFYMAMKSTCQCKGTLTIALTSIIVATSAVPKCMLSLRLNINGVQRSENMDTLVALGSTVNTWKKFPFISTLCQLYINKYIIATKSMITVSCRGSILEGIGFIAARVSFMNVVCFDRPVVSMISSCRYAVNVMWAQLYALASPHTCSCHVQMVLTPY